LRSSGDPVLFINNPEGVPANVRRRMLDGLAQMNQVTYKKLGDPETQTRIAQYEMAYRMQSSVPELTNLSEEPAKVWEMYGPDDLLTGQADRNRLRTGPSPSLFQPVDGWRRNQRRCGARRD